MSRRRKKNPLLGRILAFVLVAHAIALPIAAHFGAFEKIRQEFGPSRVVMVTVPPLEEQKKPPAKEEKKAAKTQKSSAKKEASAPTKSTSAAPKSNLSQPKVVAAGPGGADAGGGPTVDPNGSGKAGEIPHEKSGGTGAVTPPATNPNPKPPEEKPTPPAPKTEPPAPKTEPPSPPVKPAEKPKVFTEAETIDAPEPTIPDELRSEPFEKTLVVEADVDTGGKPQNVRVVTATGVKQLDDIGIDTAKRYRFRPAKLGDEAVEQHVRFRIIFKVE